LKTKKLRIKGNSKELLLEVGGTEVIFVQSSGSILWLDIVEQERARLGMPHYIEGETVVDTSDSERVRVRVRFPFRKGVSRICSTVMRDTFYYYAD
jgi:hypothetical protein